MAKYRKKPVVVEATQWWLNESHVDASAFQGEGHIVRYFRTPELDGKVICLHCNHTMHWHGWIETLEGGHIVCPGDWIITGIQDEHYSCKPDIFEATYEKVDA